MTEEPLSPAFNINVPPEHLEGHYADFASVWHNNETFILDFVSMSRPPTPTRTDEGGAVARIDAQVVTRVRIPAAQVWEVMKALQAQLGQWEQENPDRKLS
ncbi:DUF3467 domain-containing protein [Nocardioides sp.]|uniref:DUF3467 domain-containing protein n=1 Tax=Nocardioides sp. TaxID=35761 RepID=UPI00271951A0|nr:DUF3467 domain-containing protein [Nocardioides sp.]MDO9456475.1 DUF3467 domain-containing protein [Nocardioides sp.]